MSGDPGWVLQRTGQKLMTEGQLAVRITVSGYLPAEVPQKIDPSC